MCPSGKSQLWCEYGIYHPVVQYPIYSLDRGLEKRYGCLVIDFKQQIPMASINGKDVHK